MNLFLTIFGGMFLSVVLYGLGRLGRLSNFWAAVMAAGVPSFAYMAYAMARWPGLDVVTVHLVAFPTVAVLLGQLYGAKADHARSLHWAPKLMIGFFLAISVVFGAFVYIAGNGLPPALTAILLPNAQGKVIHTGFAGVVEHHEGAAKGIGQYLKMEERLTRLGWRVEVSGLSSAPSERAAPISVHLRDRGGWPVNGVPVSVDLLRPGQKPEAVLDLAPVGSGEYQAQLPPLTSGTWVARLNLGEAGADKVVLEHTLQVH